MKIKTITAHCLVKNEARFMWFSVMSVINRVDKVLLWDTGSTDGTQDVIKEILKTSVGKEKVSFKQLNEVTPETFAKVRQEMLDATRTDWFIVVDGDEIWWESSISKVIETISEKGDSLESIVVPTYNLVGDIYHYQDVLAGNYDLAGKRGHLNLRGVKRYIPGLSSSGVHGVWGWTDSGGKMIQDRDPSKIIFIDAPYIHATHLPRGADTTHDEKVPKRSKKLKYEIGISFPADFYYPEVFFRPKPEIVNSPWVKMSNSYKARAILETPLKKIKRKLLSSGVGY